MADTNLSQTFDAIVVGSGATGGWAAKRLSEAGLTVAVLEAGRNISPSEFAEHMPAYKLHFRDMSPEIVKTRPVQKQCYACMEYNYDWFVNDLENPYSTPKDKPFTWQRLRIVGGRTMVWGRQSYRLSDLDFRAYSHDGYGQDWPISYADLAPYYDIAEDYVGINGAKENHPPLPDGHFLPPMALTCGEEYMRDQVKKTLGHTITIGRVAMLTENHNGRAACHYCGPCERGCITNSYFNSIGSTLPAAAKTGRMTLRPHRVVAEVLYDAKRGRARGVRVIDALTMQETVFEARIIFLCASAIESSRILLNSRSSRFPNGLANSSGTLGRYLMDHHYGSGASGH